MGQLLPINMLYVTVQYITFRKLKYKIFTFSNIIPEPSMSQQCTTQQKNHLNLTNMASFHHFCIKQSKTAQILYERGAIIYESPCTRNTTWLQNWSWMLHTGWFVNNGPPLIQDLSCFWLFYAKVMKICHIG